MILTRYFNLVLFTIPQTCNEFKKDMSILPCYMYMFIIIIIIFTSYI